MGVVTSCDVYLNSGAPIVPLEWVKLGISNLVCRFILRNTNTNTIDYPQKGLCSVLCDISKLPKVTDNNMVQDRDIVTTED